MAKKSCFAAPLSETAKKTEQLRELFGAVSVTNHGNGRWSVSVPGWHGQEHGNKTLLSRGGHSVGDAAQNLIEDLESWCALPYGGNGEILNKQDDPVTRTREGRNVSFHTGQSPLYPRGFHVSSL